MVRGVNSFEGENLILKFANIWLDLKLVTSGCLYHLLICFSLPNGFFPLRA